MNTVTAATPSGFCSVPEAEAVRTVVMKGKAPVDSECKAKLGKVSFL